MATFLLAKKVNEHSVDAIIDVENQRVMCVVDTKAQGEWVAKALELLDDADLVLLRDSFVEEQLDSKSHPDLSHLY